MAKTSLNYKLIYEARARGLTAGSETNAIIGAENDARAKAQKLHKQMRDNIAKLFGSDDLDFSNIACMADGIRGHVYHPNDGIERNLGKRVCIFCGCDDFDF